MDTTGLEDRIVKIFDANAALTPASCRKLAQLAVQAVDEHTRAAAPKTAQLQPATTAATPQRTATTAEPPK